MSATVPDLRTPPGGGPRPGRDAGPGAQRRARGDRPGGRANADAIAAANAVDVEAALAKGENTAIVDRLTLTPPRIVGLADGVRAVIALPDPIGAVLDR